MPTLNWVNENHPMVLEILTHPSSRKQFGSGRKKGHGKRKGGSYLYIHLY